MPAASKALSQKGRAEPTADLRREAVEEISNELRSGRWNGGGPVCHP